VCLTRGPCFGRQPQRSFASLTFAYADCRGLSGFGVLSCLAASSQWTNKSFIGPECVTPLCEVYASSRVVVLGVSLDGEGMIVLEQVYQVGGCLMKTDDMAIVRPCVCK
jgi:hypothetical protein